MAKNIYGIEEFGGDELFWRVVWFGGTKRNPRVRSEPQIQVLLAALPESETDPLSQISRRSVITRQEWIGVGQLPYVSIGSVWHNTKPQRNPLFGAYTEKLVLDTSSVRFVSLGDLAMKHRAIPKSHYLFAGNFSHAGRTLVAAIQLDGDPWAVLIPVTELIRFYYASSTRLAQALFWGVYAESINPKKCGQISEGPYRIHLRKWIADTDAWTLARFHASRYMQQQVRGLYTGIQKHYVDSFSIDPGPFQCLQCGFPFAGETTIDAVTLSLPGPTYEFRRILILRLLSCSAPFPFDDLLCDRDNRNLRGKEAGEENLPTAWRQRNEKEDDEEEKNKSDDPAGTNFHSDGEPSNYGKPLVVDLREDRFPNLAGKKLIKERPDENMYCGVKAIQVSGEPLEGFGTGAGIWGQSDYRPAQVNTNVDPPIPTLPVSLDLFFVAIAEVVCGTAFTVHYVAELYDELVLSESPICLEFPMGDPATNQDFTWAICRNNRRVPRARQVVVAVIELDGRLCYVFEAERLRDSDTISVLLISRRDSQPITGKELWSILLASADKGSWMSKSEMTDYFRKTATHKGLVEPSVLTRRIVGHALEMLTPTVPAIQEVAEPSGAMDSDAVENQTLVATSNNMS
ncbi:MAG: hypothetical protein NTV11_19495 [Rhodocyclales bacterium]|nr:hypothetical protein [Rhodocyclales bacterium]